MAKSKKQQTIDKAKADHAKKSAKKTSQRKSTAKEKPTEKNAIEKKVRNAGKSGAFKKKTESSLKWYIDKLKSSTTELATTKGLASTVSTRQKLYVGGMYQYVYDAKTKEQLPYWDSFPCVVIINLYSDGFLGLNLHYLPPIMRAKLLDKLMDYSHTIKTGKNGMRTYMRLSYTLLTQLTQVPFFKHCVKRYLYSHVKSKVMRINADFWEEVAFLPTQQFHKASHSKVWADAKRYK